MLDNLQIGANVVSAALECEVTKLINFSSSCVYPPNSPQPFRESQILTGALEPTNEGYAMAKLSVQKLVEFGARQFDVEFKTLIPSNLYGPRDNFKPESSHLLAAILYKIRGAKLNNLETVEVWGDGSARREFTYVGDLSRWVATEALDHLPALPLGLNVGCGYDYSVAEYYKAASEVLGYGGTLRFDPNKPSGMQQKLMDSSNAKTFGWKPTTDLHDGIRLTTNWMEKNVE
jgi:GDP-L-fucose synthase